MTESQSTADEAAGESSDGHAPAEFAPQRSADALAAPRCRWCRRGMPERSGPGRPPKFCSQKCRQWNWVARQRSEELAIDEDELVIARAEIDMLHDDLYILACALRDAEADLEDETLTPRELRRVIAEIMTAAGELRDRELRPGGSTPRGR